MITNSIKDECRDAILGILVVALARVYIAII